MRNKMRSLENRPYRLSRKRRLQNYFGNFKSPFTVIMCILIFTQTITVIFSLYWLFSTSLKNQIEFAIDNIGLPPNWRFDNYSKVFTYLYVQIKADGGYRDVFLWELIWNSLLFAVGHTAIHVFIHTIAGYVLAKFRKFWICRTIVSIIIVLMALPLVTSLAASLELNIRLGVYDNFPMILYTCIGIFDSATLIYMGAYSGVHNSYIEAAKIDGAGNYRILFTIAIPLIKTIIVIQSVTCFISFWNDCMTPYLYMPSMPTLSVALLNFSQTTIGAISNEPMQMAASALVCIPCLILFFIFRDKMVGNLTMGGLKG